MDAQDYQHHCTWMREAIALAQIGGDRGEIPVGALVIDPSGHCIAKAHNQKEQLKDPTAHAEILALRAASQALQSWHLNGCTLYVTLEPCPMCAGGIIQSRLGQLIYGINDPKTGAIRTVLNLPDHPVSFHPVNVIGGILELECRQQLQQWFRQQRLHSQKCPPKMGDRDIAITQDSGINF